MPSSHLIINSKIHIPTLNTNIVLRQQVFEKLNQWDSGVLLISAPAGYGKTTTLASWIQKNHLQYAWLSLDTTDDSYQNFIMYLCACLQIEESIDEIATNSPEALIPILNTKLSGTTLLVLEDYYFIQNPNIHKLVENIAQYLNEKIRLIIITRHDPPLPLAKWRVRSQLTEIRSEDLRFTKEETTTFFKQVMKMDLPTQEIKTLETRTEGWVAGLQLVALSLRKDKNFSSFNIQGNQRTIADYLMAEVLNQLSAKLKRFLLQTSILKRLSASLCNAVTERGDSQIILENIEADNLFVVSLDATCEWFRYHHLFTDFLSKQLSVEFSENDIQALHKRASRWFEEHGFFPEAIGHALAAKDFDHAACLLGPQSEVWMRRGESSTIIEALKQLPDSVAEKYADLCVWYGWGYAIRGELLLAEVWVSKAEKQIAPKLHEILEGNTNVSIIIRNAYTQIFAIRALIARQENNFSLSITLSEQALATVPEQNLDLRAIVLAGLSSAKIAIGDFSQADEITYTTHQIASKVKYPYLAFTMLMNETVLGMLRGQLYKVHEASHAALQLCEREAMSHLSFLPHIRLGRTYYLWNQLTESEDHMHQGIESPKLPDYALSICNGTSNLALLQIAQGKPLQAFETLEKVKDIARTYQIENGVARAQAIQAMIQLSAGDIESVSRWVKSSSWETFNIKEGRVNFPDDSFTAYCRYLIFHQKDWKRTQEVLAWRVKHSLSKNRIWILIDAYLLLAIQYQAQNQNRLAMQNVYEALKIAKPENFLRPFIDYEKPMHLLLNQIPATHEAFGFAQKIVSNFAGVQVNQSNLIEKLNEQEIKILQLIAKGHTNPEIARQLSLAVSTVRWYVKHIYRKLNVHNRTQATLEAQKQNLI